MVIYGIKTFKIENKTQPANMAATEPADFHQPQVQNICGCFFFNRTFWRPDVLTIWRYVKLMSCKPDVLDVLKPDVLKPDVLWVYPAGAGSGSIIQRRESGSVPNFHGSATLVSSIRSHCRGYGSRLQIPPVLMTTGIPIQQSIMHHYKLTQVCFPSELMSNSIYMNLFWEIHSLKPKRTVHLKMWISEM